MTLKSLLLIALTCATSCTITTEGEYVLSVDPDCLACFPMCNADGNRDCVNTVGEPCGGCRVACIGGLYVACFEDGPHCYNHGPAGDIEVPVICDR